MCIVAVLFVSAKVVGSMPTQWGILFLFFPNNKTNRGDEFHHLTRNLVDSRDRSVLMVLSTAE